MSIQWHIVRTLEKWWSWFGENDQLPNFENQKAAINLEYQRTRTGELRRIKWTEKKFFVYVEFILARTEGEGCPADLVSPVGRSLLIRDRESALWLKLVFGLLFCALSVDQKSRGCGSCLFIRLGAFRMWLDLGVEVWEFALRGVRLGWFVDCVSSVCCC